jgi:hypothetical protein
VGNVRPSPAGKLASPTVESLDADHNKSEGPQDTTHVRIPGSGNAFDEQSPRHKLTGLQSCEIHNSSFADHNSMASVTVAQSHQSQFPKSRDPLAVPIHESAPQSPQQYRKSLASQRPLLDRQSKQ